MGFQMPEYNCVECGRTFASDRTSRFGIKYCSDKCRYEAWKRQMRQRAMNYRNSIRSNVVKKFIMERNIDIGRLQYLMSNQQFETKIPLEIKCWLCNSTEDLLSHEIK